MSLERKIHALAFHSLLSNMNSYGITHYKKEQVEQLVTKIERNVAFVWQCRNGACLSFVLFEKIHFISYKIIHIK